VFLVVGARPNFMKAAALCRAFRKQRIRVELCHTGQHYDRVMSDSFFRQLGLPRPKYALGIGSGSHAEQTGRAMIGIEKALLESRPGMVMVVGDVNSTVAGALAAVKLHVPVAHVEAGLRSGDRRMPEEINRIVTDAVSDYCFVTEEDGRKNLRREGFDMKRVFLVGDVMVDTLLHFKPRAARLKRARRLGLSSTGYALSTLHRPGNVDEEKTLSGLVGAFEEIAESLPFVLAAHPRTRQRLKRFGLLKRFEELKTSRSRNPQNAGPGLWLLPPQEYLDFMSLVMDCRIMLTDSGGLQEETSVLGVPCLTLRWNTERPVTLREGTSKLVGNDPARVLRAARRAMASPRRKRRVRLWDGKAGGRIAKIVARILRGPAS